MARVNLQSYELAMMTALPIEAVLPDLVSVLTENTNAVLAAPPGAGKTTRVPLALLHASWAAEGKIVMLEPRRIAARAAAGRLAEQLGEDVGQTVGYRIRGESRQGRRIEVVTEGVLTRMLQSDPDLPGIAAVLFDEVHERSIHTDLGMALCLEVQNALRPDLRLVAMSATLDTGAFARLMNAPVIESAGQLHPVETRWLDRPWRRDASRRGAFESAAADLIRQGVADGEGDVLAFLPGAGEIERVGVLLSDLTGVAVVPLYGALPFQRQRAVLRPGAGRRVILATAIAETSLTVPGVRTVVDAGRARRARVDPATGLSRLVTVPVSRAEADQRRGRAGRLGPGLCLRMWTKGEEGGLPAEAPPEILEADLAPLALELAAWGQPDPAAMAFLDPPPAGAYAAAQALLRDLEALDEGDRLTAHGRRLAALPTHPRLAHMLERAGPDRPLAAMIAALVGERDPLRRRAADMRGRLEAVLKPPPDADRGIIERVRAESERLTGRGQPRDLSPAARLAALAWPDRIALRRPGDQPRYLLSGGRGAVMDAEDALAGERLLVVPDLEDGREARIRLAIPIAEAELRVVHGARLSWQHRVEWSARSRMVEARSREMLGAVALDDRHWKDAPTETIGRALLDGIRDRGLEALAWTAAARRLRARMDWARRAVPGLPDWSDIALTASLEAWLLPHLAGERRIEDLRLDLGEALMGTLDWDMTQALNQAAPSHFQTPLGKTPVDYSGAAPEIRVRVQELFGLDTHPSVGGGRIPLTVTLLSPAQRPVQTTGDLPGFWRTSYSDVRKDMRARYPRHPWPEEPWSAEATRQAKARPKS